MSIPEIKFDCFLACLHKATTVDPIEFGEAWLLDMVESGQRDFATSIVGIIEELLTEEGPTAKLKALNAVAITVNAIKATIEAEELEEMFKE